jgi:hypothetical protein
MKRNKPFILASIIIFLAAITCQTSGNPVSTPVAEQIQTARALPTIQPTSTVSAEQNIHTIFPSFSLPDSNAVCVAHYYLALSCLDANGWHAYKNDYDENTHPTSTTPNQVFGCPDGRIYLVGDTIYRVEGETLVDIGGYVDMGSLVCGRGNEIWISDLSEVQRFDGSTWTSYAVEDYFESHDNEWTDSIHAISVAPDGNVWVATDNAIATFDGAEWNVLTLPGKYYFDESRGSRQGLAIDSNGVVWVVAYPETCCADGQLLKFDQGEWGAFPSPEDGQREIKTIAVDDKNRIWAFADGNKIFMLHPDTNQWELQFEVEKLGLGIEWEARFETQRLGLGYGNARLRHMEFDRQGRLWIATNYGVGIYDGATWKIYHTYTSNLYINEISELHILGDVSQLPALKHKTFGSIRGTLVSETQTPFTDALVEICINAFAGYSICSDQDDSVNADGSFVISNIPPGIYRLHFKISAKWYTIVGAETSRYFSPDLSAPSLEITVNEGQETNLGEITAP